MTKEQALEEIARVSDNLATLEQQVKKLKGRLEKARAAIIQADEEEALDRKADAEERDAKSDS